MRNPPFLKTSDSNERRILKRKIQARLKGPGILLVILLSIIIIAVGAATAAGSLRSTDVGNNGNFSSMTSVEASTTLASTILTQSYTGGPGTSSSWISSSSTQSYSEQYSSSYITTYSTTTEDSTTESWTSISLTQTLPTAISGCTLPKPIPTGGYNLGPEISSLNSSQRYIVLRFDDTLQSQWLNALPVLTKYHFKALFLAITSAINNNNQTGYPLAYPWATMSWPEMEWLYQNGFEIADHSATHKDLNSQSCAGLNFQIYQSRQNLFSHNMTFVPVFVDPSAQGASNQTVADYIYASGFSEIYPITTFSLVKQPTWYDMDAFGNPKQSLSYFESIVNQTISTNVIGVFYHNVNDHVPCCTPFYTNTTAFDQDMAYLYQNNFTIILPDQLPSY